MNATALAPNPPTAAAALVRGTQGNALGPAALKTREQLLLALGLLLESVPWRALTITEVARWADTSPASFYQYFTGLEDAVYALADSRKAAGRRLSGHLARVVKLLDYEQQLAGRS